MKKRGILLTSALLMLFATTGVNAATTTESVGTWANLKTCLQKENTTCKLTADITETGESDKVAIDKENVTLDLAGYTLTLDGAGFLRVNDGKSLTITSSTAKKGTIEGSKVTDTPVATYAGGSLTVDNVILTKNTDNNYAMLAAFGDSNKTTKLVFGSKAEITGTDGIGIFPTSNSAEGLIVDISGDINVDNFALTTHGTIKSGNEAVININSGASLTSNKSAAIYQGGKSTINIKDGSSVKGVIGVVSRQGTLNVTGGKVEATGTGEDIRVGDAKDSDGFVKLPVGIAVIVDNTENSSYPDAAKVTISGGTFEGKVSSVLNYNNKENTDKAIAVSAGTFNQDVDKAYLASTDLGQSESGKVGTVHEIEITESKNGKVTTKYSNAVKGEEVKINVTASKGYELAKIVVIDAKGKEVKVTNGKFTMPDSNVTITVTFKKVEANPATGDNLLTYVSLGAIALIGTLGTSLYLKKVNE